MAKPGRSAGIDVAEDIAFQRRFWRVQRAGWAVMTALVLAGLAGFFGHGPASKAALGGDAAHVRYERLVRWGSPVAMSVTADPAAGRHEVAVALASEYVERMGLVRAVPMPARTEMARGTTTFVFASRDGALAARFEFKPDRLGAHGTDVRIGGATVGRINHLVLP